MQGYYRFAGACRASDSRGALIVSVDYGTLVRMEKDHPVLDGRSREVLDLFRREQRRDTRERTELADRIAEAVFSDDFFVEHRRSAPLLRRELHDLDRQLKLWRAQLHVEQVVFDLAGP